MSGEYIIFALLLISCIFAAIEAVRIYTKLYLSSKRSFGVLTVVPLFGGGNDAEYIVRSLIWKSNWKECCLMEEIVLLDLGVDEETALICQKLSEENSFVYFLKPEELKDFLIEKKFD
jgi:hypothetical protein